jgi:hypothetical protein
MYQSNRIIVRDGAIVSDRERAALASLFPSPSNDNAPRPALQIVGADVDHDGDEDTVYQQMLPLTVVGGLSFTAGQSQDLELRPLRLFQPQIISVEPTLAAKFIVTALSIGQEDQFVAKGAVPLAAFAANSTYRQLAGQWAGPGVPITLTIKNIDAAVQVLYGVWFGSSIVG